MPARLVVLFQRRLVHYRVPFFEALRARLAVEDVELRLVHGTSTGRDRLRNDQARMDWADAMPTRAVRFGGFAISDHDMPLDLLARAEVVVVPHEVTYLPSWRAAHAARRRGVRLIVWGHGRLFQGSERAGWLRRRLARLGDLCFAYTDLSAAAFAAAGVPRSRIVVVENAVAAPVNAVLPGPADAPVVGFLGSLTPAKRLGLVIATVESLRARIPDLRLRVVGDGPEGKALREAMRTRPWIEWCGSQTGASRDAALDGVVALLNPGMVGLSLLDSFAYGVPLVTMEANDHSPEIAYLRSGENGVVAAPDAGAFEREVERILVDREWRRRLVDGCRASARRHTLDAMADNFAAGLRRVLGDGTPVAVAVWRSFLPYHLDCLRALRAAETRLGVRFAGIEVTASRPGYDFLADGPEERCREGLVTAIPDKAYGAIGVDEVRRAVLAALDTLDPVAVFCPATPFPEGMAATTWCLDRGRRVVMMDDSWEATDRACVARRSVKRLIHGVYDAVFVPSLAFAGYWRDQGVQTARLVPAVYAVDESRITRPADRGPRRTEFLFVGRDLPRKGLATLLAAHQAYASSAQDPWTLVVVGPMTPVAGVRGVSFRGALRGTRLIEAFWDAGALVVPSDFDQWGLVVNEAIAAGLPVLASRTVGAARALVDHGTTGWLFEPGDADGLARLLAHVSGSPDTARETVAQAARQRLDGECSLARFVDSVECALRLPRTRPPLAGRVAARAWRGHLRVY